MNPRDAQGQGDDAVSDVIGTVLLVGITLLIATSFSLLVLSIDGPADVMHVNLVASIGTGPDLDWGTNDAEFTLKHLGGEPLYDELVEIVLEYEDGSTVRFSPTFPGGILRIGQEYTTVISAEEGQKVGMKIIGKYGAASELLVNTVNVANRPSIVQITFPDSYSEIVGSVSSFTGLMSNDDGDDSAIFSEAATAGASSFKMGAFSAIHSNAVNPDNVLVSDNVNADLVLPGSWVESNSFPDPGTGTIVSQLLISVEGSAPVSSSLVTHIETVANWGIAITQPGGTSTHTSAIAQGVPGQFYLAAIENGDTNKYPVLGVTGMNLLWERVDGLCASEGIGGCVEVWRGSGTPVTGAITAEFNGDTDKAAIAISRYTGVDLSNPIYSFSKAEGDGNGGSQAWQAPSIESIENGMLYVALGSHDREGSTWTEPTNVRASIGEVGANEIWMSVADGQSADVAHVARGNLIGGADDWHVVALVIRPQPGPVATGNLSYTLSGVEMGSSKAISFTSSEQEYTLDITGDRTWAVSDLANLGVRLTKTSPSSTPLVIDHQAVTVTLTDASSPFTMDITVQFLSVPDDSRQNLQIRYRVADPGDSFYMSIWDGSAWRTCPGTLSAQSWTTYNCELILPAEYQAGSPLVRFTDFDQASVVQGSLELEYLRIATS